jgi:hypothetical protein
MGKKYNIWGSSEAGPEYCAASGCCLKGRQSELFAEFGESVER